MRSKIESLHLESFRNFRKLDVNFNSGFNFIAGPNGCGKTSILAGIGHCFSRAFEYSRFHENAQFWTDVSVDQRKYRIGSGVGFSLAKSYRANNLTRWGDAPIGDGRISVAVHEVKQKFISDIPLFIGAQRNIKYKKINGLTRDPTLDESIDSYIQGTLRSLYGDEKSDVKQWLINRYFVIDKDWAVEEKANWNHLVSQLPHLGPFDSNFSYIRTGRDLEPVFRVYGNECYLEEVSSGFQAVLLIVIQIIEWIEKNRPEGSRIAANASGTVLIDELDLHLHPEWQLTIREGLARLFPNLQFIVTTHSPHLLASALKNEVIVMPGKTTANEEIQLAPLSQSFSGWTTDQILSEVMGVRSLDNKLYERLVATALEQVEKRNIDGLKSALAELRIVSHPDNTILVVLTARLAALEALGHD